MIFTVNGPISKNEMGITLGHEHFKWEYEDSVAMGLYYNRNYGMTDVQKDLSVLLPLLSDIRNAGVCTVVEASPPAGGQNLLLLRQLSMQTGLNIIPSTGWNAPREMYKLIGDGYAEILAKRWISDFKHGLDTIDGVQIKPGYIKLLLERGGLFEDDKEMLRAAVMASNSTGMPIHCHILEAEHVIPALDYVENLGLDLNKFLWAHADKEGNVEVIVEAHRRGCWLGIDIVRRDMHTERVQLLQELISMGLENRLLLSQDYDFYEAVTKHGKDHPCASLMTEFLPLCVKSGMDETMLLSMLKDNPAEFYDI